MQVSIRYIADLISGIYVNTSASKGKLVYYLQLGHWNKERKWAEFVKPELCEENRLYKNYLQVGDILLATKGMDRFAVLYDGRYAPAVASSVFTVLRVKDVKTILPAYLQWYLNHPDTAKKLSAASRGTSTPLITHEVIEQLELPVPSLDKQGIIIRAQNLQKRATQLRTQINKLNEIIFQHNLLQIADR
ncbi:restriction endonuclease subunit S [Flavitalea sp. BT771]|uniref:restriction endonuclease subunit S n=1 Tax=Flavitalea sp. BT771 TaxID=3063329 RepID=UPI0026E21686|nr:restriction endonuclease subunit S [Flavitalea sp. BT771]MDO6435642.1 restriction endonuclease subunit S [Flavitalea sp. BT771]MDV6224543.1 restriction endonuclease subunit S [Flavitalea sp. BT771]